MAVNNARQGSGRLEWRLPAMELAVLIPAYNEADIIARTVETLQAVPEVKDIVVVDDGSTDGTGKAALLAGARVVRLGGNSGKSAAVMFGMSFIKTPYVALLDADVGASAVEIRRLLEPIVANKADMTVAVFPAGRRRGGFGLVKKLAGWAVRRCTGLVLREPLSGQRIMRRELLQRLSPPPRGYGLEVALALDLLPKGCRLVEVETRMYHRERGRDAASFWHRGRQLSAVLRELWVRRNSFGRGREQ